VDGPEGRALVPSGEFGPLDALSDIAHGHYVDGFAERCVECSVRWEPLAVAAGDQQTRRYLLYSRSIALQQLGRYAEALDTARALLALLGEHDDEWRAKTLAVIAETSTRLGRPGRALNALAEADGLCAALPSGPYGHVSATMAVALALRSLVLYEQADARLSIPEFRTEPHRYLLATQERAHLAVTWGVSLLLTGADGGPQFRRAGELGLLVQRLARATGRPGMEARGVLYEAFALMRLGHPELAEARALSVSDTFDPRPELLETQLGRFVHATTATRAGRYDDALALLRKVAAEAQSQHRELWLTYANAAIAQIDVIRNGEQDAVVVWRTEAQRAIRPLWAEREARFEALRQREAVRRLTAETDRMGRVILQDPLTGLGNRLMLTAALESLTEAPAIVFVDVDDFKSVNDRFTHAVGDDVLHRLAQVLRAQCRAEDVVVRYGGDEFVVVTTADDDRAETIAHRVRHAVGAIDWSGVADGLSITVSVGVGRPRQAAAHHGPPADGVPRPTGDASPGMTALSAADVALLEAKRAGRNRVITR